MVQKHTDIRCKHCNSLLAREERDGLCIRRGDMQLIVSGAQFTVSVTCYRCRTLNVVDRRAA
jgi:phage FluMu protein Com